MDNLFYAAILIAFCIFLYIQFCYKPKIKIVKIPKTKQIRKQKKKARRIKKFKRLFRLPYHGKTDIIQYDKKQAYIESAWNELNKK